MKIETKTKLLKFLVESAIDDILLEQTMEQEASQLPVQATGQPPVQQTAPEAAPEQPPVQVMSLDEMIESLNMIRGGRSFTDPEVYTKLGEVYKTFSDTQKSELGTSLKKIVEVIINPGQVQTDVSEPQTTVPKQPDPTQMPQTMSGVGQTASQPAPSV